MRSLSSRKAGAAALKLRISRADCIDKPRVLGPATAPLERLRGQYRMQILVKSPPDLDAISILQDGLVEIERRKASSKVHVDVDPLSLL